MSNQVLKAALWYAQRMKWRVLPLHGVVDERCACGEADCGGPGKRPWDTGWTTLASSSPEVVRRLFARHTCANVGVATGAGSGLAVLDIDPRHGGEDTLHELVSRHGPLPHTLEVLTGGGGRHLYFRHPGGYVRSTAGELGPGLDVRGDGGQVAAPPSEHVSGRRYTWEISSRPGEVELAPMPPWLEVLTVLGPARTAAVPTPPSTWDHLAMGAEQGTRNQVLTRVAGLAFRKLPARLAYEFCRSWAADHLRPPLSASEVDATLSSIASRELARRTGRKHV